MYVSFIDMKCVYLDPGVDINRLDNNFSNACESTYHVFICVHNKQLLLTRRVSL